MFYSPTKMFSAYTFLSCKKWSATVNFLCNILIWVIIRLLHSSTTKCIFMSVFVPQSVNYTFSTSFLPLPLACSHSVSVGDMFHLSNNLFLFIVVKLIGGEQTTIVWKPQQTIFYVMVMKLAV